MEQTRFDISRRGFLGLGAASAAGIAASLATRPARALALSEDDAQHVEELTAEAAKMPSPVKRVVFLQGSWKDMGRQYAAQVPEVIDMAQQPLVTKVGTSKGLFSKSAFEWIRANAADVAEFYDGIAEQLGTAIDDLLFDDPQPTDGSACCTLAAWGSQTADGRLLVGTNMDADVTQVYYYPAVVGYPEGGHAFVSPSGTKGNCVMNDAGLVLAQSSGQHADEGDTGEGMPLVLSLMFIAANAATAAEAEELFHTTYPTNTGDNMQFHDAEGNHVIAERTASKYATRTPGDFGEKDYSATTNDFMCDELQASVLPAGSGYDDCRPRYWSLEQTVLENTGAVTLDTIASALNESRWYEDGAWHEVNWDARVGLNSPENVSPFYECLVKTLADPANMAMYVMNGCANTEVTSLPGATGNYCQITLAEDPDACVRAIRDAAIFQMFMGGRDAEAAATPETRASLDEAKRAFVAGESYKLACNLAADEEERVALLGRAASCYLRAQCNAQLAQADPAAVVRDYLFNA